MRIQRCVRSGGAGFVTVAAVLLAFAPASGLRANDDAPPPVTSGPHTSDASWTELHAYLEYMKRMLKPTALPAPAAAATIQDVVFLYQADALSNVPAEDLDTLKGAVSDLWIYYVPYLDGINPDDLVALSGLVADILYDIAAAETSGDPHSH